MSVETVTGKSATIEFNGQLCIHARRCVLSQPGVFKANVEGPWIDPDALRIAFRRFMDLSACC